MDAVILSTDIISKHAEFVQNLFRDHFYPTNICRYFDFYPTNIFPVFSFLSNEHYFCRSFHFHPTNILSVFSFLSNEHFVGIFILMKIIISYQIFTLPFHFQRPTVKSRELIKHGPIYRHMTKKSCDQIKSLV